MKKLLDYLQRSIKHILSLETTFTDKNSFASQKDNDSYKLYKSNLKKFNQRLESLNLQEQLYSSKDRQMVLADLIEYIFLGRGFYTAKKEKDKKVFIQLILYHVNLLMCYEDMTVSDKLRESYLNNLLTKIKEIEHEDNFQELKKYKGIVGISGSKDAGKTLDSYFDSLLPKTAGGLWHELLVYIFLLRENFGYIVPLLLSQRLLSRDKHLVPPDFLVITHDKHIFGIEVGRKKEIQSGNFSLITGIPTASLDTENSRVSDRCPICNKWINFCDYVIEKYSDVDSEILKAEIRCLADCTAYDKKDIAAGKCEFTKYKRKHAATLNHTHHEYSDNYHYHYQCV